MAILIGAGTATIIIPGPESTFTTRSGGVTVGTTISVAIGKAAAAAGMARETRPDAPTGTISIATGTGARRRVAADAHTADQRVRKAGSSGEIVPSDGRGVIPIKPASSG